MRRFSVAAAILFLACITVSAAAASPKDRPTTVVCPDGYVCVPVEEMAERTARVWEMRGELAKAKARNRRLGGVLGCGVGVSGVVVSSTQALDGWRFETAPAVHCGYSFGWRF